MSYHTTVCVEPDLENNIILIIYIYIYIYMYNVKIIYSIWDLQREVATFLVKLKWVQASHVLFNVEPRCKTHQVFGAAGAMGHGSISRSYS